MRQIAFEQFTYSRWNNYVKDKSEDDDQQRELQKTRGKKKTHYERIYPKSFQINSKRRRTGSFEACSRQWALVN